MTQLGAWSGRRVLITGHTGFKGAWLSLWLHRLGAHVTGLSLPPADVPEGTYRALSHVMSVDSQMADLRNAEAVERIVAAAAPDVVFHLAAQSLVRRGWADPAGTYAVNVVGTSHLLEAVALAGCVQAVVVVTSDKVYANDGRGEPFCEDAPLGGNDPYSASKAAAELVVRAWRHGHPKIPVATVRAGNVIGGGDLAEDRLLPDVWRALRAENDLLVRHPEATRPWQFVLEPLAGYLEVAERLLTDPGSCPPAVNFGPPPSACWPVARVVDAVFGAWGSGRQVEGRAAGGLPEAPALRLDATLASQALGWSPRLDLATAISWTVDWWRFASDPGVLGRLAQDQIAAYERLLI